MEEKKLYKSYKKTAKTTAYKPKRGKLAPLMTEETVLGRVSKLFTWIVIVIVVLLVGEYSYFMLG